MEIANPFVVNMCFCIWEALFDLVKIILLL